MYDNTHKILKALQNLKDASINLETDENLTWGEMKQRKWDTKKAKDAGEVGVLDPAKVCMIVPKNQRSFKLLYHFLTNWDDDWSKAPRLSYDAMSTRSWASDEKKKKGKKPTIPNRSAYSTEYLVAIFNVANAYATSTEERPKIKILMRGDYPITIEMRGSMYEFDFIVAPRVDQDE